jgi:signal peptidase II
MAMSARRLGLLALLATLCADQANKLWLIYIYDIEARQPVRLAPFFDVVFAKNPGISYSLLRAETGAGRLGLLILTLAATAFLSVWLWQAGTKSAALGLGCIVGGALGNAYDRLAYGYVADFYYFHAGSFSWYVFNLADTAIVAGVMLLIYDAVFSSKKASTAKPALRE